MNEIIGRSNWAPTVFGTAAPDTGNAEILALFGTPEQKQKYLGPLMDGDIVSCFSMTEPQGGADPGEFHLSGHSDQERQGGGRVGDRGLQVVFIQRQAGDLPAGDRRH